MKRLILIGAAVALSGCVVEPARYYAPAQNYYPQNQPQPYSQSEQNEYQPPEPQSVVSVYVDPPLAQPAPVMVAWAPPPMLVETPPPMPYEGAVWIGGYWAWEGNWVWAHGRWAGPPRFGYGWVNPYYENRGGSVVFVNGFWAAPGVTFVAPPVGISISVGIVAAGVIAGPRCHGPEGVFVPAPPGSHFGLIVPAPIGTSPAVVTSAPPIINSGMRITTINNNISNVKNVTNITNVTNVNNVTIVAPASATANGQAVNTSVPAQAHLAAAMTPLVHAEAPAPISAKPIPAYVAGHQPAALPMAQMVRPVLSPSFVQQRQAMNQRMQPVPQQQAAPRAAPAAVPLQQPAPRMTSPAEENRFQPNQQKPQQFEQRPQQNEQRPQQNEQRPQQNDQRPQQNEQRPQQYEQRPQQYEQRPQQNQQRPQQFEQRPPQSEQRPQQYQQKPPVENMNQNVQKPAPQVKEKKSGEELGKKEHELERY